MAQGGFEVFDSDMHVLAGGSVGAVHRGAVHASGSPGIHAYADGCRRAAQTSSGARAQGAPQVVAWGGVCCSAVGAAAEGAGPGPSLDPDSQRWARMFLS